MSDADLAEIEAWFVARGLPHFVDRHESVWDIWSRAVPLLVIYFVLVSLNALDVYHYTLAENVAVAVFSLVTIGSVWIATNAARGRPWLSRPQRIGPIELAVLIVGPLVPTIVLGQFSDALEVTVASVTMLALIWFVTSYGVLQLARWAWTTTMDQLGAFANMIFRALPLLLMFTTFLFINAEVWQVAGTLAGPAYVIVLGSFFVLGATFLLTRIRTLMRRLNRFATWHEVDELLGGPPAARRLFDALAVDGPRDPTPTAEDRPRRRQRFNAALVALFPQALQITAAAIAIVCFFLGFGFFAIPASTVLSWTGQESLHEFFTLRLSGRRLSFNEPLVRVAGFLGAFTGMYFTVVLSTDSTYREEFAEDVGPALRTAFAVRVLYRRALTISGGAKP